MIIESSNSSNYWTPSNNSNFTPRNDQFVIFNAKMKRLWAIHHLCEQWILAFQALTDHFNDDFMMWILMLSDNSNLSDNLILTLGWKTREILESRGTNFKNRSTFHHSCNQGRSIEPGNHRRCAQCCALCPSLVARPRFALEGHWGGGLRPSRLRASHHAEYAASRL